MKVEEKFDVEGEDVGLKRRTRRICYGGTGGWVCASECEIE